MSQRSATNPRNVQNETSGVAKKSAARAKPARSAATTVRVVSAKSSSRKSSGAAVNTANLTKEQKRERRAIERDAADRVDMVANILMKREPSYAQSRRMWWILLVAGLVMVAISWAILQFMPEATSDLSSLPGQISMATLILAYAGIIGALVYDLVKVRPVRNKTRKMAEGMSEKRLQAVLDEDRREVDAELAAKNARKAAKNKSAEKNEKGSE